MRRVSACALVFALCLPACALMPLSSQQRLSEAAYDMNNAARFGRMDLAIEQVSAVARADYAQTHAAWGKSVRVVDAEFAGVSMRKDGDADVMVTLSWQRANESTIRVTDVSQRWTREKGSWWMLREEEKSGDRGLLGDSAKAKSEPEAPDAAAPAAVRPAPPERARYQTKVIYGD